MLNKSEYFEPIDPDEKNDEFIVIESKSFFKDVCERFVKNKRAMIALVIFLIIALMAIFGPMISPYSYDGMDTAIMNQRPSAAHWFGTDRFGRDLFTRVLYGARISLMVGIVTAVINTIIGVIYGGIAGYVGGRVDMWMMRLTDILYSIPELLYIILIMLIFGSNVRSIIIGVCVAGWISMARMVRSQIITLKEQEFALAAFVLGANSRRILFKHLIVNSLGTIIVTVTLMIPQAIFMEAFLSFVGVGISAPMASLGTLAQDARTYLEIFPYQMLFPVAAICVTIFSLNFIGEGLNSALNPKGKR